MLMKWQDLIAEAEALGIETNWLTISEILFKLRHFPAGMDLRIRYLNGRRFVERY